MSQDRFQRLISSDRLSGSWEGRGIKKALTAIGPRVTFQSSPAPKGRCYSRFMIGVIIRYLFQSSPAPKGRCYANELERAIQKVVVSILTGPEGPVLQRLIKCVKQSGSFNPHRPRRAGATVGFHRKVATEPGLLYHEWPLDREAVRRRDSANLLGNKAELEVRAAAGNDVCISFTSPSARRGRLRGSL